MANLFDRYVPAAGRYDELSASDGRLRPHWQYLANAVASLDTVGLAERQAELRRLLQDNGISYNQYEQERLHTRPWPMDLLPLVISSREWREIEVGVAQRAELLRQIMHDLYGAQRLIRSGLLPAQIIHGHRGFLLPCTSADIPAEHQLIVYGADLGRDPQGRLWVTGDRTQAPSGIGYALAARTVSSRVLPSVFRESNVHPILPFLRDLRSRLIQLAEDEVDRIAVLTPGPANETHPEHAYLARHLGLPLVEGADLRVSGGACWLNDHDSRRRISVLLRRLDDDYCDPLELNRKSLLGVPGCLQAVRNRQLGFANPLGSGVLENPALMSFLPELCRQLLGEELKLPSRETWWCGHADSLAYVQAHLDDLLIRPILARDTLAAQAPAELGQRDRSRLLAQIQVHPERFVAQRLQAQPIVPVLRGQEIVGHPAELRTFAISFNNSFRVMSGGLARAGRKPDSWRFSNQLGGSNKDIWVLASEQQRYAQTLPQFLPRLHQDRRIPHPHLNEKLFWLGRYGARAEFLARLLLQAHTLIHEDWPQAPNTQNLLQALSRQTTLYPGFLGPEGAANRAAPMAELLRISGSSAPGGLRHDIDALAHAADALREVLTPDLYRLLEQLQSLQLQGLNAQALRATLLQSHSLLLAVRGLIWQSLTEDTLRATIEVGMALEQSLHTVGLLRAFSSEGMAALEASATLLLDLSLSASGDRAQADEAIGESLARNLLVSDRHPQSVRYQLMLLERLLRSLPWPGRQSEVHAQLNARLSQLGTLDVASLFEPNASHLLEELQNMDQWLRALGEQLDRSFQPYRPLRQTQLIQVA